MGEIRRAFTEEMTLELGLEGWLGFPWEWGGGVTGRELRMSHFTEVGKLEMRGGASK